MKPIIRSAALFFCAILIVSAPFPSAGEMTTTQYGDFAYLLEASGAVTIAAYTGDAVQVVVPEMLDGRRVIAIGDDAFSQQESIRSVTLPNGLERIGDRAFYGCYGLSAVTLPEGLKQIGNHAFFLCENLLSLSLPVSLEDIGRNPFAYTPANLSLAPGNPRFHIIGGVLFSKLEQALISYPYHSAEEAYIVPEDVQVVGDDAFLACRTLTAVSLPDALRRIGDGAYSQCENLASMILPPGLEAIGDSAFSYCESLVSIDFPDGLLRIGNYAFVYCGSLLSAVLKEGLTEIGDWAFGDCGSLQSAVLPASVSRIGDYAFGNSDQVVLHITQGSYAQAWARKNGVRAQFARADFMNEEAPSIPDGTLAPLNVSLPMGQKLPVYCGPGEKYARAGKGKASVSTNGWVQVFGMEGDWLLIQYGISQAQMRFGYVSAAGLKLNDGTVDLTSLWEDRSVSLVKPANLTDDPLASVTGIAQLPLGLQVRRLGWMGPWVYVEVLDGARLLRGFVPSDSLPDDLSRDERLPFDLRAVSWGRLEMGFALQRYFSGDGIGRLLEAGALAPNVWLRLDSIESRTNLESLMSFRVVAGRASCGERPVPLNVFDSQAEEWLTTHFMPKEGFSRSALEISLDDGESLENVVIACTRMLPDGNEETLILPLAGVPESSGYPAGGIDFSMHRFTPFARTPEQMAAYQEWSGRPATLEGVLEDTAQAMPDAPQEVLGLPYDTPDARLYLLEGEILKEHGPFGAYDVTFSLDDPPDGVWLAAYQQCAECSEIDAFDMFESGILLPDGLLRLHEGDDAFVAETLRRDFAILLLVRTQGRNDLQMDSLINDLRIIAAFSAEKWNVRYEQHLETTAIGPRSRETVSMKGLEPGRDVLTEIP